MSCKTSTVTALAAAMLLTAAPAALAQNAVCSCGQPMTVTTTQAYTNAAYQNAAYTGYNYNYGYYRPVAYQAAPAPRTAYRTGWVGSGYAGHWHGNTYFGYGSHWGTSVDAQLFAASANGDLWSVKRLVERGAHVDARDSEGLSPLSWAAQYGRVEVARYLLAQKSNLNPADKFGFTPLMWAAQEGHTPMVELLLSKGANPWVTTRTGVSAHTLARYSGSWTSAAALENWLNGRRSYTNGAGLRPASVTIKKSAAPIRVTAAPVVVAPVASAPVISAPATMSLASAAEPNMLAKLGAFKKLAETGARFADSYQGFMKGIGSGGFGLNTLSALSDPDVESGKQLSMFFANVARTQDLKAGRAELVKAKGSLKADSKFATFADEADKALAEAGL